MRMNMKRAVAFAIAATSVGACSLDLQNPNSPTEAQVTTSVDGVIALATGLQGRFAMSYGNFAYMAGLVTDEFASTSAALISISDAEQGAVPSGTGDRRQRVQLGVSNGANGRRPARRLGRSRRAVRCRHAKRPSRARLRAQGRSARRSAAVVSEDSRSIRSA